MTFKLSFGAVEALEDEISEELYLFGWALDRSSFKDELEGNLRNSVESFEVIDDLSDQNVEGIWEGIEVLFDESIFDREPTIDLILNFEIEDDVAYVSGELINTSAARPGAEIEESIIYQESAMLLSDFIEMQMIDDDEDPENEEAVERYTEEIRSEYQNFEKVDLSDYKFEIRLVSEEE